VKDVDFCSGALLITPRDLFLSVGGFDSQYAPAYYEDADYCLQLWDRGYRVVFQPFSIAIHHEFGSSKAKDAIALQIKNREKFLRKWKEFLKSFDFPDSDKIIFSRERKTDSKRILFIDDMIPDYHLGSGYPRTYRILHLLAEMGYKITFFPLQMPHLIPEIAHSLQLKGVEVLYAETDKKINFEAFIKSRSDYYDIAFVSRPHNMHEVIDHLKKYAIQTAVVYDAEALFSLRDVKLRELNGRHITETEKDKLIQAEVSLVKDANVITTVSKMEKGLFLKYGISSVQILGHVIEPNPTPATFEERKDILFVGGILSDASPNADAVRYFINQILPLVRQKVNCDLYVVGTNQVKTIWDMESDYVHIIGRVNDLTSYYNRCRLFVVPTRYSAGIPLKLLEAAAHGVPAVVTPLTADQLGWQENRDFLVGATPKDFASKVIDIYSNQDIFYSLRQNALDRIREEYSPEVFSKKLVHVLNLALHEKEEGEISALIS
jgi:glycosyltransferase involved in cell wall biosynthesis